MKLINDFPLGRFIPGSSPLHQLDPRIKAVGSLVLVVAVFSASNWGKILVMTSVAGLLVGLSSTGWRPWWRALIAFRWLLLFSLLLYLLFSPGRTLWGVSWLSWDGLQRGAFVCSQLLLAIAFSSLLTFTTEPSRIASALSSLFSPLERWGIPVRGGANGFLMVLEFIPILQEETKKSTQSIGQGTTGGKLSRVEKVIVSLIWELADRADQKARESLSAGTAGGVEKLKPLSATELWISILVCALGGGLLWGVKW